MSERTQSEKQEVALTILNQLGGGIGRLKMMVGANQFLIVENGVQFRFKMCKKANTVVIKLNGMDLYDITFYKITPKKGCVKVEVSSDNYADMLRSEFERFTGLTLTVPRVVGINY